MRKKGTKKETLKEAHDRNKRAFLRLRKKLAETHNGQWKIGRASCRERV